MIVDTVSESLHKKAGKPVVQPARMNAQTESAFLVQGSSQTFASVLQRHRCARARHFLVFRATTMSSFQ